MSKGRESRTAYLARLRQANNVKNDLTYKGNLLEMIEQGTIDGATLAADLIEMMPAAEVHRYCLNNDILFYDDEGQQI